MEDGEIEVTISLQDKRGLTSFTRSISAAEPHPELRLMAKLLAELSDELVDKLGNSDLEPIATLALAEARKAHRREGVRRIGEIVEEEGLPY